ncbi:MAG TPA: formyltransferase family protein [Saprospiraceae bacterium]|nr:formyltransferase family protein [Saprospiraceae bacterium]HNB62527.1 formyltransferase family protein [Saprospiraceae bacterium]HNB93234.1 formyltransferase family protein [Saprospiraceae bacterium]HNK09711.1 formyltransferase family protein [Saprospiraceae bacterium]HNK22481.1 formyltransferase family protein [Saprospiraceae bacterium]
MGTMKHLAIFASGGGSNAQAIMKHFRNHPTIQIALVLYNKKDAGVKNHAAHFGIPARFWSGKAMADQERTESLLGEYRITGIILAGYLSLIPEYLINQFPDKILNIHPALLPSFGGKGMYSHFVHEAVSKAGHIETGITIHLVNKEYDKGRILFQKAISIRPHEDSGVIARQVLKIEHQHYAHVIEDYFESLH